MVCTGHATGAQQLPRGVSADPVEAGQAVLPQQLRGGQTDQELTAGQAAVALLDRSDMPVEHPGHTSRSVNSATALSPENAVSDPSGAPMRTRFRLPVPLRMLFTEKVPLPFGHHRLRHQ
ncbi:hypothetical protein BH20ACT5_BH20ACT5_13970 [soil metagenome]